MVQSSATARAVARPAGTGVVVRGIAGALAMGITLCGCSAEVDAAPPSRASSAECAQVTTRWPQRVADRERVQVRDKPQGVAAWGDPAIIARCGVAPLPPTTAECIAIDSVDWVVEPLSDGSRFTTFGRSPALEVLVPRAYAPEPLVLGAFTHAADTLPRTDLRCR